MDRAKAAIAVWLKRQQPRYYWKVLVAGILVWVIANSISSGSGNAPLLALDFLVGAALVPLCFLLFWYEECAEARVPGSILALSLAAGGTIGLVSGILVESALNPAANWGGDLLVGVAEEAGKGLAILLILRYAQAQLPHRLHGLLVGVAVGAGFAAVETMGYGLSQFIGDIQTPNASFAASLADANATLISRMVLSPYGHVAWAGILGAAIWRERRGAAFALTTSVVQAFAIVVVLHGLFDGSLDAGWPSVTIGTLSLPVFDTFVVGPLGLITLSFFVWEARQHERLVGTMPLPSLATALKDYYWRLGVFLGLVQHGPQGAPVAPESGLPPASADTAARPPLQSAPQAAAGVTCAQCGVWSGAEARFCSRCGHPLGTVPPAHS